MLVQAWINLSAESFVRYLQRCPLLDKGRYVGFMCDLLVKGSYAIKCGACGSDITASHLNWFNIYFFSAYHF